MKYPLKYSLDYSLSTGLEHCGGAETRQRGLSTPFVGHQDSQTKFQKTFSGSPQTQHPPAPWLWYAGKCPVFTSVTLHLQTFSYMDTSTCQRCYGDRRFGFVFIGSDCLENFNLQTGYLSVCPTFLAFPFELFVAAKYWDSIAIHLELLQPIPIAK